MISTRLRRLYDAIMPVSTEALETNVIDVLGTKVWRAISTLPNRDREPLGSCESTDATYCEHGAHDHRRYGRYRGIRVTLEAI